MASDQLVVFNGKVSGRADLVDFSRAWDTYDGLGAAVAAGTPSYGKSRAYGHNVSGQEQTLATGGNGNSKFAAGYDLDGETPLGLLHTNGDGKVYRYRGEVVDDALPLQGSKAFSPGLLEGGVDGKVFTPIGFVIHHGLLLAGLVRSDTGDDESIAFAQSTDHGETWTGIANVSDGTTIGADDHNVGADRGSPLGVNGLAWPEQGQDFRLVCWAILVDYQLANQGRAGGQVIAVRCTRATVEDQWTVSQCRTVGEVSRATTHSHTGFVMARPEDGYVLFGWSVGDGTDDNCVQYSAVEVTPENVATEWLSGTLTTNSEAHGNYGLYGYQFTGAAPLSDGSVLTGCDVNYGLIHKIHLPEITEFADLTDYKLAVTRLHGRTIGYATDWSDVTEGFRFGLQDPVNFRGYAYSFRYKDADNGAFLLYSEDGTEWATIADVHSEWTSTGWPTWYGHWLCSTKDGTPCTVKGYHVTRSTVSRRGVLVGPGGRNDVTTLQKNTNQDSGITIQSLTPSGGTVTVPAGFPREGEEIECPFDADVLAVMSDDTGGADQWGLWWYGESGDTPSSANAFELAYVLPLTDGGAVAFKTHFSSPPQFTTVDNQTWTPLIANEVNYMSNSRPRFLGSFQEVGVPQACLFALVQVVSHLVRGHAVVPGPLMPPNSASDLGDADLDIDLALPTDWSIGMWFGFPIEMVLFNSTDQFLFTLVDATDSDKYVTLEIGRNDCELREYGGNTDASSLQRFHYDDQAACILTKTAAGVALRIAAGAAEPETLEVAADFDPANAVLRVARGPDDACKLYVEMAGVNVARGLNSDRLDNLIRRASVEAWNRGGMRSRIPGLRRLRHLRRLGA